MTPAQRQLYFRTWGACAKARGWTARDGREADSAWFAAAPDLVELHTQVWNEAGALAALEGRDVSADDLRHACHRVAGAPPSSAKLSNADLDRVLALFRLLADPDDLDAMLAWENPEASEAKRLLWAIRRLAPEAYTRALASDRFHTKNWEALPVGDLRQLALTLRLRKPGQAAAAR
jgi:hypothetical protein